MWQLCLFVVILSFQDVASFVVPRPMRVNTNIREQQQGKPVECETDPNGSCRVIRGALKAELNEQRMEKRKQGLSVEDDYMAMLSGGAPPPASDGAPKKFSPFKKATPPPPPPP
jgi:hypothetical protein